MSSLDVLDRAGLSAEAVPFVERDGDELPAAPETIEETGLTATAVIDLLLKALYAQGVRTGQELIDLVCLPFPIVDDLLHDMQQRMLVEVQGTAGHGRGGYRYSLTATGRARAVEALEFSTYVGPAPVPLAVYAGWIRRQSVKNVRVTREGISEGLQGLTLDQTIVDSLGPAINSARSLFLYGAPGNGKTAIAERIAQMAGGDIWIPHAIDVDGQTVILFDPVYHEPLEFVAQESPTGPSLLRTQPTHDVRFVKIRRPAVFVGGELALEQLDLQHDPVTKVYKAPFQLKAAGGVLILDDFGRQRVEPRVLLNRWVVPLEKGIDFLALHTGVKFPVPFDCRLVFATNLDPGDLVEEAFLRRIHYKIRVGNPDRAAFANIMKDVCDERGITYQSSAVDHVWDSYYRPHGIDPRACHPRDLADHIEDFARFQGTEPTLDQSLLDPACNTYFLLDNLEALTEAQSKYQRMGGTNGEG